MFKYLAVLIGLICLFSSISAWISFDPLDNEAEQLTVSEACNFQAGRDIRYVTFDAELDTDHRIYRTGLSEPFFTARDPSEIHRLEPAAAADVERMNALLGCMVSVNTMLDPDCIGTMQLIVDHEDEDKADEIKSEKCIGPLLGSNNRLLALSPTFRRNNEAESNAWIARTSFTGRLCRLRDMKRNAEGVTHDVWHITNMMRGWGRFIPDDAFVILTEKKAGNGYARHLVPVADSGFTLLLDVSAADEQRFAQAGTVTGVLEAMDAAGYRSAADALGVTFPDRIGILTNRSAASYNAGNRAMCMLGTMFGLFLIGAGGLAIWLKWYLRAQRRRRATAAMSSAMPQFEDDWRAAA